MKRHWSPARVGAGLVIGAWAALFWFVWAAGRTSLYLSTRTAWLIPMGAILMTVAAVGRLASARVERTEHLGSRETVMFGVIALPVVLLLALPPATLGSYAAGRRSNSTGIAASARIVSGPIDFVDIAAARSVKTAAADLRARAGERVTMDGFVTVDEGDTDRFQLTRFVITCCVADATVAQVRIVGLPPGNYPTDEWLQVTGAVYPVGREVLVAADTVQQIPVPSEPYLTP